MKLEAYLIICKREDEYKSQLSDEPMKSFYQVNWINGMKINAGHSIDLENHFISRIQQSIEEV